MALSTQYFSYSVGTGDFDTAEERKLYNKMMWYKNKNRELTEIVNKLIKNNIPVRGYDGDPEDKEQVRKAILDKHHEIVKERAFVKKAAEYKEKYSEALKNHTGPRRLRKKAICDYNQISLFESILSRTLGIKPNDVTLDLITVQVYFYTTMEQLIKYGFRYKGEHYQYYTSSAAAIRLKKGVFIKSSVYEKYKMTLTCGMPVEEINQRAEINATKYLAYTALLFSAVDVWPTSFVDALRMGMGNFNIRKCIVVPDYEVSVRDVVDHINNETYEITRQEMDVAFDRVDGCGMILPRVCDRNFVFRAPWMKGLLCSFDFERFIMENDCSETVMDVWGKKWDVLADGIEVIFTESMFKLAKCYKSWDEYCTYFEQYGCLAGIANMEETGKPLNARFNYQYLQSLPDITDDEIKVLTLQSNETLRNISSDRDTMLRVLGATNYEGERTPYQDALALYPELLRDEYSKKKLRDMKNSLVKRFKSAKLESKGYFTFVVPDLYAFCEYLFMGMKTPRGLLGKWECSCRLLNYSDELVAMRSPALYREQVILQNIQRDNRIQDYFDTDAIYISNHDMLARIVQMDYDGDRLMVTADPTFREIVKRNWRNDDIVPLYFDLKHADGVKITPDTLWTALQRAFKANKIGVYANLITKAWSSAEDWTSMKKEDKQLILDVVKYLTLEENINIDSAKSGYNIVRTEDVDQKIKACIGGKKVPYFFKYAKDREEEKVEEWNASVINRIGDMVINPKIHFTADNLGHLDWRMLVNNPSIKVDEKVVEIYKELSGKFHVNLRPPKRSGDGATNYYTVIRNAQGDFKKKLPKYSWSEITDMVFKYLYYVRKNVAKKDFAWAVFGEEVVNNLTNKLPKDSIQCENCGYRFVPETVSAHQKYCNRCAREIRRSKNRTYKRLERIKMRVREDIGLETL